MKWFYKYLISCVITSIGALIIYAKQHDRFSFDFGEFLLWLPLTWVMVLILAFLFQLLLRKKDGNHNIQRAKG